MNDIARSMRKKGYEPLAADSFGGIGFRKNLKVSNEEDIFYEDLWLGDIWFDTGKKMQDGLTPRTIVARNKEQYAENLKKGYSIVKETKASSDE